MTARSSHSTAPHASTPRRRTPSTAPAPPPDRVGTPFVLRVAGATHVGRRRSGNQDTFLIASFDQASDGGEPLAEGCEPAPGPGADPAVPGPEGRMNTGSIRVRPGDRGVILVVCDGMGSAPNGAVAAHLAGSAVTLGLRERWRERKGSGPRPDPGACLREAVEGANRLVHARARARSGLEGMGTTVTAAVLVGATAHLAQVGDSRAYLLRRGRARLLTRDQTVAQEMLDLGLLSHDEAARSPYRNVLAQSLGPESEIDPAIGRCDLEAGDAILLCTDGLTAVVGGSELAHFVARASTLSAACRRLVALANERGAPDDVTVVIGRVEEAEHGARSDEDASV